MADLSKLKTRRNSLGDPPAPEAASRNLLAPEVAPAPDVVASSEREPARSEVVQLRPASTATPKDDAGEPEAWASRDQVDERAAKKAQTRTQPRKRVDGRTLRKTGRTVPLSLHVSPAFDDKLRMIAERDGLLFSVVLEKGLDAYEADMAAKKKK